MKPSKKVAAALARRINGYTDKTASGLRCVKPGSQNRKKGFAVTRSARH